MKLNNKGFAISTVIYGFSIMGIILVAIIMATMASTRSNSRQLAKSIEEELNRFSKTETFFGSSVVSGTTTPQVQDYIVPTAGWYKIELWGSSGKGSGSNGAYTTGIIELNEGEVLHFYVGPAKSGREADVRLSGGSYNDAYSASTRIMVAAGGGSDNNAPGGTLYGYTSKMKSIGGLIASDKAKDFGLISKDAPENTKTNGTLIGYPKDFVLSNIAQPGVNSTYTPSATTHANSDNGGGDGYYPSNISDTGGISFIAGYAGSLALDKNKVSINPKVIVYEQTYNVDTDDGGGVIYGNPKGTYYFVDGMMMSDVNNGAGKAKIERMVVKSGDEHLTKKNNIFNNTITSVKDCVKSTDTNVITKISVISKGEEKVTSALAKSTEGEYQCATANFDGTSEIDEIAVFHKPGTDYQNNSIKVFSTNTSNWQNIKNTTSATPISETETPTGMRISAYQFDSTTTLPNKGNYYLLPVLSENKVVTAAPNSETSSNPLEITGINGYKRQRWAIEKIEGTNYYKLYELARYNALTILNDENIAGNKVGADEIFNKYTEDETQYWLITPVGNNTYIITTKVAPFESGTGNVIAQTNQSVTDFNKIIIGKNNNTTTRFKIISVDYSSN